MIKDERYVDEDKYIIAPSMYSKDTDTHQYLSPKSCHPVHITKNILTTVAYRCKANCSDKIKNDVMFKEALIEYKAYLIKSGYDEKNVDKKLINFAVRYKRKNILENKIKKKRKSPMKKYHFVTNFEPTFPDIKTGLKKFKQIIEDDEELKKIFPHGIKHFQVSEKRGSKNIKEILAPSNTCFSNEDQPQNENEHVDEINGSHPCNKPCVYCNILRKTESNEFKSNSNGQTFNIRQNINCQSENVVYLIWCEECKLQGVGRTLKMSKRLSNYYSHIKQKRRTCSSVNHFIDKHVNNWKDVLRIMGIVKLTNPPRDKEERKFRLLQFEGYWQVKLGTVHPHGLNDINELKEWFQKFRNCKR